MQVASRPRFTTGVALVGASLVVASTVAPVGDVHLPDLHLPAMRSIDVDLAAAVNPLAIYSQVLHDALANIGTLAENAKPGQVLQAILANQLGGVGELGAAVGQTGASVGSTLAQLPQTVTTAVGQLAAGNVAGAADTLLQLPLALALPLQSLLPALADVVTRPLENVVNVIHAFTSDTLGTELILAGLVAPLISTPAAAATALQNVIGAVATGNPAAVVDALLGAPATVADGLLNGGYGPDLGPLVGSPFPVKAGGLLSSSTLVIGPDGIFVNTGGPIAAVQQILNKIAGALTTKTSAAVKPADVASVPTAPATTVTLSTGSTAAAVPAKPSSTETKAASTETKASSGGSSETESSSTTKDSGVDVTSGNKVEPKSTSTSESTKTGDVTSTTSTAEATTEKTETSSTAGAETSGASEKSAQKSTSTAKHAHAK